MQLIGQKREEKEEPCWWLFSSRSNFTPSQTRQEMKPKAMFEIHNDTHSTTELIVLI
jgi:hypothetical protein